jgi:hypothetical protein
MIKQYLALFALIALIPFFLSVNTPAHAAGVWKETDVDLITLLDYDFKVIDTHFSLTDAMKQSIEVIYLTKDKKLFRCFTFEIQNQTPKHWCETLQ